MNHTITIPYPFPIDTSQLLSAKYKRIAIQRFFDFNRWLQKNAIDRYEIDDFFDCGGITVHFMNESDQQAFSNYIAQYFIHLHD